MATVVLTAQARKQAQELPKRILARMDDLLVRLAQWPEVSGVKALRGNLAGKYRMRTGDYRLQFHVESEETIVVERIGHRSTFYED